LSSEAKLRQWLWFAGLYLAGLLVLSVAAWLIRALIF